MTENSYLTTHKYVRYLVFAAAAVVIIIIGKLLFPEHMATWIEAIATWVGGFLTPADLS